MQAQLCGYKFHSKKNLQPTHGRRLEGKIRDIAFNTNVLTFN